ncbi:hypothetical protein CONPUDRAFT_77281 [Coniophora puteana RWD-64-598 SS2]|uniref:Microtubule associated protein n=1 Tax=Coniophora puteana (strain RWD-64-598) TaxID=741705 RepID=A0A5M3M8P5_CONPW|nr:uncharacterized protein CONPUDRAFT_77281 [Coniophora puteana RWD-64-598 SS2]EIW75642.1 hypothetical protein CONPUDRAFT_77281 [Coniophora puteana RWD-64-598 SS2]
MPRSPPPPSSSSSVTISTLLNTLHTHLNAQTQHLPTLHAQLGLPLTALEDELNALQISLTRTVEAQIEVRRQEVRDWVAKCEDVERGCVRYVRALGTGVKIKSDEGEQVLPRRHERAVARLEKLRQTYHSKLEQLTALSNRLNGLAQILGPNFFPPEAGSLACADETEGDERDVSQEQFSRLEKELVKGKAEVTKRVNQLAELFVHLDWLYSELGMDPPHPNHPDPHRHPSSSTLAVPSCSLPRASFSSTNSDPFLSSSMARSPTSAYTKNEHAPMLVPSSPASRASSTTPPDSAPEHAHPHESEYLALLGKFITLLDSSATGEGGEEQQPNPTALLHSMRVQPIPALVEWAANLCDRLSGLKKGREAQIQAMYDQLEGLWRRMGVPEEAMDGFVEANCGTTEASIAAYEEELERMVELKRERMGEFVDNARKEIQKLWDELMIGEQEREACVLFWDDEPTTELLTQHEQLIGSLKAELKLKLPLLTSVRKYFDICEEEKELARVASDQTRLLARGPSGKEKRDPGRLLREEKMRKRVQKEKPKVRHFFASMLRGTSLTQIINYTQLEQHLVSALPAWEAQHERHFLVHGERLLDLLQEQVAVSEQEKENKKRSSQSAYAYRDTTVPLKNGSGDPPVNSAVPLTTTRKSSTRGKGSYVPDKSTSTSSSRSSAASARPESSMSAYTTPRPPSSAGGRVTPAVRSASAMSTGGGGSNKRQKMSDGSSLPRPGTAMGTGTITRSRTRSGSSATSTGTASASRSQQKGMGWGRGPGASTVLRPQPVTSTSKTGVRSASARTPGASAGGRGMFNKGAGAPAFSRAPGTAAGAGEARRNRMKRESFRPRASIGESGVNLVDAWRGTAGFAGAGAEEGDSD